MYQDRSSSTTFSYMLFALGIVLIIVGIYLTTYTTVVMVNKPMTIYGYTVEVPTAEQIQPYTGVGIIAITAAIALIGLALYKISARATSQVTVSTAH